MDDKGEVRTYRICASAGRRLVALVTAIPLPMLDREGSLR